MRNVISPGWHVWIEFEDVTAKLDRMYGKDASLGGRITHEGQVRRESWALPLFTEFLRSAADVGASSQWSFAAFFRKGVPQVVHDGLPQPAKTKASESKAGDAKQTAQHRVVVFEGIPDLMCRDEDAEFNAMWCVLHAPRRGGRRRGRSCAPRAGTVWKPQSSTGFARTSCSSRPKLRCESATATSARSSCGMPW